MPWPPGGGCRYGEGIPDPDRIVADPAVAHGKPIVRGTRMRVADVLALLAAGASESEIVADYPYLSIDDIRACLGYAAAEFDRSAVLSATA